jgi:hypothetical protein
MSTRPGSNQWTMTPQCKCAAHAGIPGCPTTRSQNGFVKRAAIALWIVPVSARSVLPSTKWSTNTQTARFGDPRRPCTAAVDSAERKAARCALPGYPARSMLAVGPAHSHEVWIKGRFAGSLVPALRPAHSPPASRLRIVVHEQRPYLRGIPNPKSHPIPDAHFGPPARSAP